VLGKADDGGGCLSSVECAYADAADVSSIANAARDYYKQASKPAEFAAGYTSL
jgi:hypothetical protein